MGAEGADPCVDLGVGRFRRRRQGRLRGQQPQRHGHARKEGGGGAEVVKQFNRGRGVVAQDGTGGRADRGHAPTAREGEENKRGGGGAAAVPHRCCWSVDRLCGYST